MNAARDGHYLCGDLAGLRRGNESLLRYASYGACFGTTRSCGTINVAGICPSFKAQENDGRDAEVIAEAATRPTMRLIELKIEEQLDMQTFHRIRDQLVGDRTSLMNQIRSLLLEGGHIVAQGRSKLAARLSEMLDGHEPVLGSCKAIFGFRIARSAVSSPSPRHRRRHRQQP